MPDAQSALTHVEWQEQVVQAAGYLGWQHLHVRRSVGKGGKHVTTTNLRGWPDLFLWHHRHGWLAIEIKVGRDTATPEQLEVLASLQRAGARTLVAYPKDWPTVQALLQGREPEAA